jgi:gluconolactonase
MSHPTGVEIVRDQFRSLLQPRSAMRVVADGFTFLEGPAWLADQQALVFSDIPGDAMFRWSETDGVSLFRRPSLNANGNTVDRSGRLITAGHGARMLTRTEPDGAIVQLCWGYAGKKLNSPNDVVVKRDGSIWFTDPTYGCGAARAEQDANRVYRLDPGQTEPTPVLDDFSMPNGLCFSPDESLLYVTDSDTDIHHIRRFRVADDNTLAGDEVFTTIDPGLPDGIRVDADGRLYSTSAEGVQVFTPAGELLGKFRTDAVASNCQFGGPAGQTLFITATDKLWAIDLTAKGVF